MIILKILAGIILAIGFMAFYTWSEVKIDELTERRRNRE